MCVYVSVCVFGVSLDCIDVLWTPPNDSPPLSEKVLSKQATPHSQYTIHTTHNLIRSTAIDPN